MIQPHVPSGQHPSGTRVERPRRRSSLRLAIEEELSHGDEFIGSNRIAVCQVNNHEILVGIIYQTSVESIVVFAAL